LPGVSAHSCSFAISRSVSDSSFFVKVPSVKNTPERCFRRGLQQGEILIKNKIIDASACFFVPGGGSQFEGYPLPSYSLGSSRLSVSILFGFLVRPPGATGERRKRNVSQAFQSTSVKFDQLQSTVNKYLRSIFKSLPNILPNSYPMGYPTVYPIVYPIVYSLVHIYRMHAQFKQTFYTILPRCTRYLT